jgi:CTP-dependent riboflavin kinase
MSDRVEIKDTDENATWNKEQSDMFEDSFFKNLKGLQTKIRQQHIKDTESKSGDMQYIGDATRRLVELKLMELDSIISARKKEEEWIRKREVRSAQGDRIAQARSNLQTLLMLEQAGKSGLEDDIEKNLAILREVENIGGEEIYPKEEGVTTDKILDSFHVTEKDLRRALNGKINILDLVRQAKKNGWTMKITDDEIALYNKHGKRILGSVPTKEFVDGEIKELRKKTATQRSKDGKVINAIVKEIKRKE